MPSLVDLNWPELTGILCHLEPRDVSRLLQTSRGVRQLLEDEALWKHLCEHRAGICGLALQDVVEPWAALVEASGRSAAVNYRTLYFILGAWGLSVGVWDAEAASDSTVSTVLLAIDVTPDGLEIRLVDYHPKDLESMQDLSWDVKPILINPANNKYGAQFWEPRIECQEEGIYELTVWGNPPLGFRSGARAPNTATRAARRAFKDASLNRPGSVQAERRGWGPEGDRWALRHFELWRRLCRNPWSPGVRPSQGYGAAGLYKYAAHEGLMMCVSTWDRSFQPPGLSVYYHEWYPRGEYHADQYPHGRVWDENEVDRAVQSLKEVAQERYVLLEDEAEIAGARKLLRSLSFNYSPAPWLCFKCPAVEGLYLLVDVKRRTMRRLCAKTRRNLAFYKHGRTSTRKLFR